MNATVFVDLQVTRPLLQWLYQFHPETDLLLETVLELEGQCLDVGLESMVQVPLLSPTKE